MIKKNLQQNKIILVLGKLGTGKTTLVKNIIRKKQARGSTHKNIIVFDVLNEYSDYPAFNYYSLQDFENYQGNKRYIPFMNLFLESEIISDIALFQGNSILVIEETDVVYRNTNPESLTRLLHLSRHKNIDVILIARRPFFIPRLITSLCSTIYVGSIQEKRDIEYLKDFNFSETDIRKLKNFKFIKKDL